MNEKNYQEAIQQMLSSFSFMINELNKNTTKIYMGTILKQNTNNTWDVKVNGDTISLKSYGSTVPAVGKNVKVFIPQGNYNLAFFM